MSNNVNLYEAKRVKNDEFYTQLKDIEKELNHYTCHFKHQTVLCNCDDPERSNFWKFFKLHFERFQLKKLIATHYQKEGASYRLELIRNEGGGFIEIQTHLKGTGDFRSQECMEILNEADIVVTNPPFSLFSEYITQLLTFRKKFLILGNQNAITYKAVFPAIKDNQVWLGISLGKMEFETPEATYQAFGNICWFTNLPYSERQKELVLSRSYRPVDYPHYDNYRAINVDQVSQIPKDYEGVMGVPITFLTKYNPHQFEILGATESEGVGFSNGLWLETSQVKQPLVHGKRKYKRLFIKRKK